MSLTKLLQPKYGIITHIWEPDFTDNLGIGNFIMIREIFARDFEKIIDYCKKYDNTYIFDYRNPKFFIMFQDQFPKKSCISCTINSNRFYPQYMKTPEPYIRIKYMNDIKQYGFPTMINIDPIYEFDIDIFYAMLIAINPTFINIDVNINNELTPDKCKIIGLKQMLYKFGLNVRLENNVFELPT